MKEKKHKNNTSVIRYFIGDTVTDGIGTGKITEVKKSFICVEWLK